MHRATIPFIFIIVLLVGAVLFSAYYGIETVTTNTVGEFGNGELLRQATQQPSTRISEETMPLTQQGEGTVYVYGVRLAAKKDGAGVHYYHQNHVSSNVLVTNGQGKLEAKNIQYPYGSDFSDTGTKSAQSSYKFTGKEHDNGFYYFDARYYDPGIGRFISIDPLGSAGISPYAYAANNPLRYVDPTGLAVEHLVVGLAVTSQSGDPMTYDVWAGYGPGEGPPLHENLVPYPAGIITFFATLASPIQVIGRVIEAEEGPVFDDLRPDVRLPRFSAGDFSVDFPDVPITVYDVGGRRVLEVEHGSELWERGKELALGNYYIRAEMDDYVDTYVPKGFAVVLPVGGEREVWMLHNPGTYKRFRELKRFEEGSLSRGDIYIGVSGALSGLSRSYFDKEEAQFTDFYRRVLKWEAATGRKVGNK